MSLKRVRTSHLGEPQRPAEAHQGPSLGHPGRSQENVVVLLQGGADESLKLPVVENFPPGEISQGVELRLRLPLKILEAVFLGDLPGSAFVFRGHGATSQEQDAENYNQPSHEPPPVSWWPGTGVEPEGERRRPRIFSDNVKMA